MELLPAGTSHWGAMAIGDVPAGTHGRRVGGPVGDRTGGPTGRDLAGVDTAKPCGAGTVRVFGSHLTWGVVSGPKSSGYRRNVRSDAGGSASIRIVTTGSDDTGAPLILVNPRASRLTDATRRRDIVDAVAGAVQRRFGRAPRTEMGSLDAGRAALAEAIDAPLVVVIGGDGSVRAAAAALVDRETPLAVIPGGTGNVLAGAVGVRGIGPGIEAIRTGRIRALDLGVARWGPAATGTGVADPDRERIFIVACGMGLDARIMAAAEHEWKRRIRFGAYVGAAFRELLRLESARFRIVADGERLEIEGYLALVANAGELVPGRIGPRQPIDPGDGRLDLIVLGGTDPLAGLRGAAELLVRSGDLDGRVIRRSVTEVSIEAEPAQPCETDGDPHPAGRLEARVMPGGLTVLAPAR